MIRRPPSTTRTDTLFPYTTLFRSGSEVLPVVVQSVSSEPAGSDLLVPVPAPPLDAGPHRSYAFQWFAFAAIVAIVYPLRSEEHTSELQSLMRISYAVFCLKTKTTRKSAISPHNTKPHQVNTVITLKH